MATTEIKILVHKETNKLLFAEVDCSFIDTLFGFLSLPIGTIVRLISNKVQSQPLTIGCFDSLYESVMNLDYQHFYSNADKDMLLQPRSLLEQECQRLKIDADCTEIVQYFLCERYCDTFAIEKDVFCRCIRYMERVEYLGLCERKYQNFVTKATKFIITDDLQVMPLIPGAAIGLLSKLGIKDMNVVEGRTERLGLTQWLDLCMWILLSKTPLTDLFVLKRKLPNRFTVEQLKGPLHKGHCFNTDQEDKKKINVKVMLKKTSKEILYVEAREDFIIFLFGFLTIPLGQMLNIFDAWSCLGSMNGLYKSIQALDSEYLSECQKNKLRNPKLAAHLSCNNQLIPLETDHVRLQVGGRIRTLETSYPGIYVKGETVFIVMDNLSVTPFTTESAISILNRSKCSLSDIEERTLTLGTAEGLSILRASLNSTSALTNGLFHNLALKETKQEL